MAWFKVDAESGALFIKVYVQPRASNDSICGIHGDSLKVRVTAPPVDDKANTKLINFFSKLLKISKSSISIRSGKQSRNKNVMICGANPETVQKTLNSKLR